VVGGVERGPLKIHPTDGNQAPVFAPLETPMKQFFFELVPTGMFRGIGDFVNFLGLLVVLGFIILYVIRELVKSLIRRK